MNEVEDLKSGIVQRIRKLSKETANLIAAGEVIVSPAHAVKELIENSLDAEAQRITIVLENSGLDTLEIRDDGNGIHKDDLLIVCERFTTSKLSTLSDLHSIKSFGFRGEALASLSFVSKVSITTCTRDLPLQQYTCSYINGKPVSSPTPTELATGHGTFIVANSLFYNLLVRRNAINVSQEYRNVLRVVQNYAIHFPHVMFSCQNKLSRTNKNDRRQLNHVSTVTSISTPLSPERSESMNEKKSNFKSILQKKQLELIRTFYGNDIAEALLSTSLTHEYFSCQMWILPPNAFSIKKKITNTFILFVNHRLVEHPTLKYVTDYKKL
jgi:DNA mismatch repair protein MutL